MCESVQNGEQVTHTIDNPFISELSARGENLIETTCANMCDLEELGPVDI